MTRDDLALSDRLAAAPSKGLSGHDRRRPASKSMSHRALILGGLARGETRIEGLLEGDDVLHTAAAVRALGAQVTRLGEGLWTVQGADWRAPANPIDCGNSGTGAPAAARGGRPAIRSRRRSPATRRCAAGR